MGTQHVPDSAMTCYTGTRTTGSHTYTYGTHPKESGHKTGATLSPTMPTLTSARLNTPSSDATTSFSARDAVAKPETLPTWAGLQSHVATNGAAFSQTKRPSNEAPHLRKADGSH